MSFHSCVRNLLILPLIFVAAGCDFDQGLEKSPTKKFDSALLGTWRWEGPGDGMNVTLSRKDDYTVTGKAWPDSEPGEVEHFSGYASEVAGNTFVAMDFGKKGKHSFLFARITKIDPKSVKYEQVDGDSAFGKDKVGGMKERLERHLKDRDLFLAQKTFTKRQ